MAAIGVDGIDIDRVAARRRSQLKQITAEAATGLEYDDLYHRWRGAERHLSEMDL